MKTTLSLLLLPIVGLPLAAPAHGCVHYDMYLHWVACERTGYTNTDWFGYVDVAISGDQAYVVSFDPFLRRIDISDPANPERVAERELDCEISCLAADEDGVYAAGGYFEAPHRFAIFESTTLAPLSSLTLPDRARDLVLYAHYALVGASNAGLVIIDVEDPEAPEIVGTLEAPGTVLSVATDGSNAYVGVGGGMLIVDLSSITDPEIIGTINTPGAVGNIAICGAHAYVTDDTPAMRVIDVSTPTAPVIAGEIDLEATPRGIDVRDGHAYVAYPYLTVIDVRHPAHPQIAGHFTLPRGVGTGVALHGDCAFVSAQGDAMGGFYQAGLEVIDVSLPSAAPLRSQTEFGDYILSFAVRENHIYVGTAAHIHSLDISDPTHPQVLTSIPTPDHVLDLEIANGFLYALIPDYGDCHVRIYDLQNPDAPQARGRFDIPGWSWSMCVSGSYAYVACSNDEVIIADVSDPDAPSVVAEMDAVGGYEKGVDVVGNHVFVASSELRIFDVSDPFAPELIGSLAGAGGRRVTVAGNYAYVSRSYELGEFAVVSVADPAHPSLVGSAEVFSYAGEVCVSGPTAYVADYLCGAMVFDISDPALPARLGHLDAGSACQAVAVAGGLLVTHSSDDLFIGQPECASSDVPPSAVSGLFSIGPNPSRQGATVRLALPRTHQHLRLTLLDLNGRQLSTLADGIYGSEPIELQWDRSHLPTGTYFLRLDAEGLSESRKLILAR